MIRIHVRHCCDRTCSCHHWLLSALTPVSISSGGMGVKYGPLVVLKEQVMIVHDTAEAGTTPERVITVLVLLGSCANQARLTLLRHTLVLL